MNQKDTEDKGFVGVKRLRRDLARLNRVGLEAATTLANGLSSQALLKK